MSSERTELGKRRVSFRIRESYHDLKITVPCGKCVGCLMERARQWSVRAVHESKMWPKNCFVTLTYRDECLPRTLGNRGAVTLRARDLQLFMKRLRKEFYADRIRFLSSGEYGSGGRPHYHCLLFNCDFSDKQPFKESIDGSAVFRSETLERLWPFGFSTIGDIKEESAAYVARYTVKKVRGVDSPVSEETSGDNRGRYRADGSEKEFLRMSRRPGIGADWFKKYYKDVYTADMMVLAGGHKVRPPRFYDDMYKKINPRRMARFKRKRIKSIVIGEQKTGRLIAKRENVERRIEDFLKRSL